MVNLPVAVWLAVFVGVIGIPATAIGGLWRGALFGGPGRAIATRLAVAAGFVWAVWAVVSYLLANANVYQLASATPNPMIGVAAMGAMAVALLFTRIPAVSRILAEPDML